MIIYLTGIDGSGKSTISNEIKNILSIDSKCEIVWARYKPTLVKKIIYPFKRNYVSGGGDYNSMSAFEYSQWRNYKNKIKKKYLLSRLLLFIQYLEYTYQIRSTLSPKRHDTHIIIDRYVLDFIVDQTINYGNIKNSIWVKKLINKLKFVDFILFIDVDESIAFSRKSDIPSMNYLTERRKVYLNYIKTLPNGFIIKNNDNINDTIENICRIIL